MVRVHALQRHKSSYYAKRQMKMSSSPRIVVLVLVSFHFAACKSSNAQLTAADMPGLYVCNIPEHREMVHLRADGTFVQTIGNDSQREVYHGHWSVETSEVGFQVMLLPYHFEWPSYLGPRSTGAWVAMIRRSRGGNVLLIVSDDDGLYCERNELRRG